MRAGSSESGPHVTSGVHRPRQRALTSSRTPWSAVERRLAGCERSRACGIAVGPLRTRRSCEAIDDGIGRPCVGSSAMRLGCRRSRTGTSSPATPAERRTEDRRSHVDLDGPSRRVEHRAADRRYRRDRHGTAIGHLGRCDRGRRSIHVGGPSTSHRSRAACRRPRSSRPRRPAPTARPSTLIGDPPGELDAARPIRHAADVEQQVVSLDRRIVDHRRAVPGAPDADGDRSASTGRPAGVGSGGEIERRRAPRPT